MPLTARELNLNDYIGILRRRFLVILALAIGGGTGRTLFEEAVRLARRLGYRHMAILADPNAAPFYQRMGARFVRDAPSDAIPGRTLPLYEYDLTSETVS